MANQFTCRHLSIQGKTKVLLLRLSRVSYGSENYFIFNILLLLWAFEILKLLSSVLILTLLANSDLHYCNVHIELIPNFDWQAT